MSLANVSPLDWWLYAWGAWIVFEYLGESDAAPWPVILVVIVAWPVAVPVLWALGAAARLWEAITR